MKKASQWIVSPLWHQLEKTDHPNLIAAGALGILGAGCLKYAWNRYNMSKKPSLANINKLPIVFHKKYDIGLFGLEKLHPFDSKKYGKVHRYLRDEVGIKEERFYTPQKVSQDDLLKIHTPEYLRSLRYSSNVARIAEVSLAALVPNVFLRKCLLEPMQYGTGGTILGAQLARENGWAINLGGGYHHAKADSGGGFCFYADIPLAVYKLWEKDSNLKVMVVDLDAHQGNGHEAIFKKDPRVSIFDIYNENIYPQDQAVKQYITFDYPVSTGIKDDAYLALLKNELPKAIEQAQPDLIIYNAGTDIYEKDPLGRMKISAKGIICRDEFVFRQSRKRKIPILMVFSGGYSPDIYKVINRSIENILRNVIKITL